MAGLYIPAISTLVAHDGLWISTHGLSLSPNDVLWMCFGHLNYRSMPSLEVICGLSKVHPVVIHRMSYGYHITIITQRLKIFMYTYTYTHGTLLEMYSHHHHSLSSYVSYFIFDEILLTDSGFEPSSLRLPVEYSNH